MTPRKKALIGAGILVYLVGCGLILRVILRPEPSSPTLTVGNLTVDVDPHWTAHDSGAIFALTHKGFHLTPFTDSLNLIPLPICLDEAEVQTRISNLQDILEKSQKIVPGSRVQHVELSTQSGPATCLETSSDLNPDGPISLNCTLHRDGSSFQGTVEAPHLNEALSMVRSTRDSVTCPAPSDDATPPAETK